MKPNFWKCYGTHCRCTPKVVGYAIAWFGVIYRTAAILFLAVTISELANDGDIFGILLSILITYSFVSLAANFLLIVGISKDRHAYLLPYLAINGIEICVGIVLLCGSIIFIIKLGIPIILSYVVPAAIAGLGLYAYLWFCLMQLFKQFESATDEKSWSSSRDVDFRFFRCSWSCCKSHSLDIAM